MALVHHHPAQTGMSRKEEHRCAVMFCLTWLGFFALIGGLTWVLAAL
jgi:hypothetical protein